MRFPWQRRSDKAHGSTADHDSPLLENASPPSMHSAATLKAYSRMPLRNDMFNPDQVCLPHEACHPGLGNTPVASP